MKNYLKPDAEIILLTAKEAIADEGGEGSTGTTSDPFGGWGGWSLGRKDDPDADRR